MAEKVVFNVAKGITSSMAGPLVAGELKPFWGFKRELEKLNNTVSTIKAVLLDAEQQEAKSEEVGLWLERLSDLLYDADDLWDAVSTEALRRKIKTQQEEAKRVCLFFSESIDLAFCLKMTHKIRAVREKLDCMEADMKIFKFLECPEETPIRVTGRDRTYPLVTKNEVMGREDDQAKIIEHLMDDTNVEGNVEVLPIVGIGGLGKTTLAELVFKDEKIQNFFELKIWVSGSDLFHIKDIVRKIIEAVTGQNLDSRHVVMDDLTENIDLKRYLLVLDGVRNESPEKWSKLRRLLAGGGKGSKILATTCSKRVAEIMFQGEPYLLNCLGEKESEDLFKQAAFRDGEWPENSRFQEIGKVILKKCAGVPLVVKMVGRLLNSINTEIEWSNFLNNELSAIDEDGDDILPILRLSYDKLPSHLKHCFAYCSIYPKDHVYDKTKIINEWIVHGFVESSSTNQSLEDVGNGYFMDLHWRMFFQQTASGYKMHYLMHDLATSVMIGSLITTFDENMWNINEKARHLSVFGELYFSMKELISRCEGRKIRTFICPQFYGEIDCEAIFSRFKSLRVLNLSKSNFEHVPNTIGKLEHLRYLDLSYNGKIKLLPRTFTRLVNLQFLNLSGCRSLEKLPSGIKSLVNLKYLDLDGCEQITYLPRGLQKLTNLQLLTQFWINSDSLSRHSANFSELKELNKLRGTLKVWNLRHSKEFALEYKAANIERKIGLECLILHFSSSDEIHDNDAQDEGSLEGLQPHANLTKLKMDSYRSSRIPRWVLSITALVELKLYKCSCRYLPPVYRLSMLKELYLSQMIGLDYIFGGDRCELLFPSSVHAEIFFPSLSKIQFEDCPNLKGWWRNFSLEIDCDSEHYNEKGPGASLTRHRTVPSFPKLSVVWIEKCPMLTSFPLSPHIESLRLEACSSKLLPPTLMMEVLASTFDSTLDVSSSAPLSKLKKIELQNLLDLETLQEQWLKNLTSLKSLQIQWCPELKSLSPGIQHLTSLEHLLIKECPKLELPNDEHCACWQGLKSLISLEVSGLLKWMSLPSGLQHVSTLRNLQISECENLTTILESIHNWKSLEVLEIATCNKLTLLPEGIDSLSSLRRLMILKCHILLQRYNMDIGFDWPKIGDIPDLKLLSR